MTSAEEIVLVTGNDDAYLTYVDRGKKIQVRPEWPVRRGRDLLARAIGYKPGANLSVLDVTVGMAADLVHLHSLGVQVEGVERHLKVYELVSWWLYQKGVNCKLHHGEATDWMKRNSRRFDVVYMDPMFPVVKSTVKARKTMDVLRRLEEEIGSLDEDIGPSNVSESELLESALQKAGRVVVKRGLKSPAVEHSKKPSYQLKGKLIRYDVYLR